MNRKEELSKKTSKELIAIILKNEKVLDTAAEQLANIIGDITKMAIKTADLQELVEDLSRTAAEKDEAYKSELEAHKKLINNVLVMTSENVAKSLYHVMKVKEHTGDVKFDDIEYLLDLNLRELIYLTSLEK